MAISPLAGLATALRGCTGGGRSGMTEGIHRVVVLVLDGAKPLDVGIPAQVFTNRPGMPYEVHVCGAARGLVAGGDGLAYHVAEGLEAFDAADTIFIPGYRHPDREDPPAEVVAALRAAYARGVRLAAISTGAFALAATGLLDGRRATTHWHYTHELARRHPEILVDEDVLFVDEGEVLTCADGDLKARDETRPHCSSTGWL
jgi:transcriptional regulator GlxA family with amidase domain